MENDEGVKVDLYIPRKWCATQHNTRASTRIYKIYLFF